MIGLKRSFGGVFHDATRTSTAAGRALGLLAVGCLCATFARPALADVQPPVARAFDDLSREHSYHLTITSPKETIQSDVLNPGGMHTVTKEGEQYVIGTTMYLKIGGKWTKVNGASDNSDVLASVRARHADYTSHDLGQRRVSDVSCEAYAVVDSRRPAARVTVYLDASGRVARIDSAQSVMTFSRFGEPVTLRPPI